VPFTLKSELEAKPRHKNARRQSIPKILSAARPAGVSGSEILSSKRAPCGLNSEITSAPIAREPVPRRSDLGKIRRGALSP